MKARVAVARELAVIAWHLLRTDTPYEERPPQRAGKGLAGSGQLASPLTP